MSNNNNTNKQQSQPSPVAASPAAPEETSLLKAVHLCLRLLLLQSTYGTINRNNESEIREAIASLE